MEKIHRIRLSDAEIMVIALALRKLAQENPAEIVSNTCLRFIQLDASLRKGEEAYLPRPRRRLR